MLVDVAAADATAVPVRILVVDDDPMLRRGFARMISAGIAEAAITQAGTADEALRLLAGGYWDLVVLDVRMPGWSGLDALRTIRRSQPALPVVMVTALPEDQYVAAAFRAGATAFLSKERATAELLPTVCKALDRPPPGLRTF